QRQAVRTTDLYTNHRTPGVRPSETNLAARTPVERTPMATDKARNERDMQPIRTDHFTDSQGNVYRNKDGRTEELRDGRWTNVAPSRTLDRQAPAAKEQRERSPVTPQRTPAIERAPQQPTGTQRDRNVQPTVPDRTRTAPVIIQQERSRGEQRVNDYRGYQQDRRATPTPPRTAPPTRTAPP